MLIKDMLIKDMFRKPIDRNIQGVIVVGEDGLMMRRMSWKNTLLRVSCNAISRNSMRITSKVLSVKREKMVFGFPAFLAVVNRTF